MLTEALTNPLPPVTRRDLHVPGVPGKAFSAIGMRRAGKTSFLSQVLADRLAPREPLPKRVEWRSAVEWFLTPEDPDQR